MLSRRNISKAWSESPRLEATLCPKTTIHLSRRALVQTWSLICRQPLITLTTLAVLTGSLVLLYRPHHIETSTISVVFPAEHWQYVSPKTVGMSKVNLEKLSREIEGNGIVIRHGYAAYAWGKPNQSHAIWSAAKPLISTLLLCAISEGRINTLDDPVKNFEPRLVNLEGGKDAGITWRQLASQTSGYGLAEKPGEAFAYNDDALTFYFYTLSRKVFHMDGTNLLHQRLARPLFFENPVIVYDDYLPTGRGLMSVSAQDMARFGLLIMRDGYWGNKRVLPPQLIQTMRESCVPSSLPLSSDAETAIIEGLPSLGAGRNSTIIGPGRYSFNWWLNRSDKNGRRLVPNAPEDTMIACGRWGMDVLMIIPSLDLVVAWGRSPINDFLASAEFPNTRFDHAVFLLCSSISKPEL